jgi:PKD domain/PASTA domain
MKIKPNYLYRVLGDLATTASPSVSHVYAQPGSYSATLTVTDDQGCSTALLYTGQTASCDGGPTASAKASVTVPAAGISTGLRGAPHCVPKLKGKKLKAARRGLKRAHCRLGKVKGQKSKRAKVKKQSPKAGKVLAPGSKVSVKLAD